uniref:Uncharacterized protein n=1 Tax=Arundo donax TaxID=35708 RepID=A0A0A9B606_ARUDO
MSPRQRQHSIHPKNLIALHQWNCSPSLQTHSTVDYRGLVVLQLLQLHHSSLPNH